MKITKVIFGLILLTAAIYLLPTVWMCFIYAGLGFKFVPVLFEVGLIAFGIFFIWKRNQPISKKSRTLLAIFLAFVVLMPAILDLKIRHDRKNLQLRAQAFLSRPIPAVIKLNANEGYVSFPTNRNIEIPILGDSQSLINRYAKTGRIRWSAVIQGQFAVTSEHLFFPGSDEIERTNQEVRSYMAERNAILSAEWRMGFWQWVEDAIDMKRNIPEIEEEDFRPAATNEISTARQN